MTRGAVLVGAVLLGCGAQPNLDSERRAILAADSAWLATVHSKNTDSIVSFWTEDARFIGPDQPPVVGREALRKMVADGVAAPTFSVVWHSGDVVVTPSGDVGYQFGTNEFTVPGAAGRTDTLRGQFVVVWRKGSDGRWRAAVDTWTPRAP